MKNTAKNTSILTTYIAGLCLLSIIFMHPATGNASKAKPFSEVEIEAPFQNLLLLNPEFMHYGGARLFAGDNGSQALIGIGKVLPEDNSPKTMPQMRRIGEIHARAAILELGGEIEITTSRGLDERSLQGRGNGKKVSLSSFFQVTETRVEGLIKQLPVIGTWWSSNQSAFYVAVGKTAADAECRQLDAALVSPALLNIEGIEPFLSLLQISPVLYTNGGVRGFLLVTGRKVLIAVGSSQIKGSWVEARKIARLKAVRSLLGQRQGIQLSSVEYLADQEHFQLSRDGEQYVFLSQFLSIQEERVSGAVTALPIVATWKDKDGRIIYVAIGKEF